MYSSTIEQNLQRQLQNLTGKSIDLKFHSNRTTYLSVYENEGFTLRLHQQFLAAPEPVIYSLAQFIQGARGKETIPLKRFVYETIMWTNRCLDTGKRRQRIHKGEWYDLLQLYNTLNKKYFDNRLSLTVTWFGSKKRKAPTRSMQIGLFDDTTQTAQVHSILDHQLVPKYVVEYVLFHEMVHALCPAEISDQGRVIVHTETFRIKEEQYPLHEKAEGWLKNNLGKLFTS